MIIKDINNWDLKLGKAQRNLKEKNPQDSLSRFSLGSTTSDRSVKFIVAHYTQPRELFATSAKYTWVRMTCFWQTLHSFLGRSQVARQKMLNRMSMMGSPWRCISWIFALMIRSFNKDICPSVSETIHHICRFFLHNCNLRTGNFTLESA